MKIDFVIENSLYATMTMEWQNKMWLVCMWESIIDVIDIGVAYQIQIEID